MEGSICSEKAVILAAETMDSIAVNGSKALTSKEEEPVNQDNSCIESGANNRSSPPLVVSVNSIGEPDKTQCIEMSNTENQAKKKAKKREDRGIEHILKTLQSMETSEEKLTALCKKYTEILDEHRTMQNTIKQNQRTITVLSREKDQLQSEHSKAVLAKSRLEGLCRELQKHNKLIKDESTARAKEDEEKRKEISTRFQTTINEIQQQMNDHYQKNTSLREENLDLANKLKGLIEQYELREANIDKILKTKEIEGQLYDAKLQQAALQLAEEKERSLQDKQKLLQEVMESQKRIVLLEQQEEQLKAQLNLYSEKYEDFQSTLTKSSGVFESFKSEMEKMTKKIKKLEKETTTWRQKWESSNKALLTLAEEKSLSQKEVLLLRNKVGKLESLCRALQEERRKLPSANDIPEVASSKSVEATTSSSGSELSLSSDAAPNGSVSVSTSLSSEQLATDDSAKVVETLPSETEAAVDASAAASAALVRNSYEQPEEAASTAKISESPETAAILVDEVTSGQQPPPASGEEKAENALQPSPDNV